jgi:hypothetical protein
VAQAESASVETLALLCIIVFNIIMCAVAVGMNTFDDIVILKYYAQHHCATNPSGG